MQVGSKTIIRPNDIRELSAVDFEAVSGGSAWEGTKATMDYIHKTAALGFVVILTTATVVGATGR